MTNTYLATVPHVLVRKGLGSLHAAIIGESVSTACGERFQPASVTVLEARDLGEFIQREPEKVCRRCDRVGNAIVPD